MSLYEKTGVELASLMAAGKVTSVEITKDLIDHIEQVEEKVRAFQTVAKASALKEAEAADRRRAVGERVTGLTGIPIAIKDNICTKGLRTTCSSQILSNFIPPYDATVITRLKQAGAVIIGKTNMDEFAMGSSTENSGFEPTHNPWNLARVPGGSSGGSAAAVAAREVPLALGSDTGGSIRQPAAFCGVMGLKPTYGQVSRYGLVAFASSLDQIGPFGRSAKDLALLYDTIGGYDPMDSTSLPGHEPTTLGALDQDVKGLRVGLPKEYFSAGLDPEVRALVMNAVKVFTDLGMVVEETSIPTTEYAIATYYIICMAEASSNLARYDGVRYGFRADAGEDIVSMYMKTRAQGFGSEVKRRIMIGTYALSAGYYDAYYLKAQKVRTLLRKEFEAAFEKYDLLLTPTSPVLPWPIGEHDEDPLAVYLADICTVSANLAGIPGLSIPCGFANGLPVGLQLMGKALSEALLLRVAHHYEEAANPCGQAPIIG
jgi:aspartyl-tRNA(Asn)/glutamyl-tRNA(Gln) amidotransferase subunit A